MINFQRAVVALFILLVALYLLVLLNAPFVYILVLPVSLLTSLFLLFLIASEISWRLSPRTTKESFAQRRRAFTAVVVGCLAFFVVGGWTINAYLLPGIFHPLSLAGNAMILVYTVFMGRGLTRKQKKATILVLTGAFALSLSLLALLVRYTVSLDTTDSLRKLSSLPYITWSVTDDAVQKTGVTIFRDEYAFRGINLYSSKASMMTYLMSMAGDMLHTWTYGDLFGDEDSWHGVRLCENGDLLISATDKMLVRLDWHSNIKWKRNTRVHHDIAVADNGDVLALARKDELRLLYGIPTPILNDYIFIFSRHGEKKREISLFEVLKDHIPLERGVVIYKWITRPKSISWSVRSMKMHGYVCNHDTPLDVFHTNAIVLIDRDIDGLCKKGNVLISVRELDRIGILDLQSEELVWAWGPGDISRQHHPTLLDNDNMLLFDNGVGRGFSRIVELDPVTREVVWTYEARPPEEFYSARMGSSQRLPNGNTLITNSESGQVFEITRDGEVVWEYYNPETREGGKTRCVITSMRRITNPEGYAIPLVAEE